MEEFYEDLTCMGMDKSEVMYTEEKKVNARTRSAHLRVLLLWATPEAQRGKSASQGCTARREILFLSAHLPAGTAELHRGPWGVDESPRGTSLGNQGGGGAGGEDWEGGQEGSSTAKVGGGDSGKRHT